MEHDNDDNTEDNTMDLVGRYILKDNIDIVNRSLTIEGVISPKSYVKFDKHLRFLEVTHKDPITIYLNSGGGDVYSMFAYIDRIRGCKNVIYIIAMGIVMSAAIPILVSGQGRASTANTTFMHHTTSTSSPYARLPNCKNDLNHINQLEIQICKHMAAYTNKPYSFWMTTGKHVDFYFTPEQAVEFGVIDEII